MTDEHNTEHLEEDRTAAEETVPAPEDAEPKDPVIKRLHDKIYLCSFTHNISEESIERRLILIEKYPHLEEALASAPDDVIIAFQQFEKSDHFKALFDVDKMAPPAQSYASGKKSSTLASRTINSLGFSTTIPLYHSGFHITLETPTPTQLQSILNKFQNKITDYGMMVGSAFFMQRTALFKIYLFRMLIVPLITSSSLENWENATIFHNTFRIEDVDTIIAHLSAAICNGSYDNFSIVCEKCGEEDILTIDPRKLVMVDKSRMTEAQIAHMEKSAYGSVTEADVLKFQSDYVFFTGEPSRSTIEYTSPISFKFKPLDIEFVVKSPTFNDVESMDRLYGDDVRKIITNSYKRNEAVSVEELANANKLCEFLPWIKEIRTKEGPLTTYTDIKTFLSFVIGQDVKGDIIRTLVESICEVNRVAYLGYLSEPCHNENCGHVHGLDGMVTVSGYSLLFLTASSLLRIIFDS